MSASVVAWNDARVTRNALSALTDRELEDIGLVRGDIDAVAQTAFYPLRPRSARTSIARQYDKKSRALTHQERGFLLSVRRR